MCDLTSKAIEDGKGNLLPYGKSSFTKQMKTIKDAIEISTAPISTWYSFT
jgi:hypothetical protein